MSEEMNLEDQLALTLDSMMTTQEALTREREEWARERAQFLEEMEQERAELAKVRSELVHTLQVAAMKSVESMVSKASESLTSRVESVIRGHMANVGASLSLSATRGSEAADRLGTFVKALQIDWKTSIERTAVRVLPGTLVLVLVGVFISFWLRSDADAMEQEASAWASSHAQTIQEHKAMKEEMRAWKEAGINEVKLIPCGGTVPGLCVRVDKKRGASGPNKDLFVPVQY